MSDDRPGGPRWTFTAVPNLLKNNKSGIYYSRPKVGGKVVFRSLKTQRFAVAKARHALLMQEVEAQRARLREEGAGSAGSAAVSVRDFLEVRRERVRGDASIGESTRARKLRACRFLERELPAGVLAGAVHRVRGAELEAWVNRLLLEGTGWRPPGSRERPARPVAGSTVNKALAELRGVFALARERGLLVGDPLKGIGAARVVSRLPALPDAAQWEKLVEALEVIDASQAGGAADLVRGLAYSGMRLGEAVAVTVGDARRALAEGRLMVRGSKTNAAWRWIPVFKPLQQLLQNMLQLRPGALPEERLFKQRSCRGALRRACLAAGCVPLTHHDLRHWFATRVIESGVDVPTLSRWLGHKDGGSLAMRTYSHVRDEHSEREAKKVQF
jgi:integrase